MIKNYTIDYDLSKKYYSKYGKLIKPKDCYKNTFNIATKLSSNSNKWRVVFGAWSFPDSTTTFALHCFLTYDEKIVDPTAFSCSKADSSILDTKYLIFKTFTVDEYLELALREKDPALMSILKKEFDKLCQDLFFNEGIGLTY